jgi:hypothetical protein
MDEKKLFGPASACQSLAELVSLARDVVCNDAQRAIAAYGMILGARSAPTGEHFDDALEVLNGLGMAKMELDKSSCHSEPTVVVTAAILSETQKFFDEMTIPSTEWPTSTEVVSYASEIASRYACAGPWKRALLGPQGQVVGMEEFNTP